MLLVFALCLLILYIPVPLPGAPLPWQWTVGGVCLTMLANAGVCWLVARLAARRQGQRSSGKSAGLYRLVPAAVLVFLLIDTLALGWPFFVQRSMRGLPWNVLLDDALILLPAVLMVATGMLFRHGLERRRGTVSLSAGRYVWLRLRVEVGPLLVSWLGIVLLSDLFVMLAPARAASGGLLFTLVLAGGVLAAGPVVLTWVWHTAPLQEGPMRDRLETLCEREGLGCRDILLWKTHRHVHNAAVVGFIPPLRYIVISDAMALHFSAGEIEAVFAHEVGHVKLKHMPYYGIFALCFLPFYANLMDGLAALGLASPLQTLMLTGLNVWQAGLLLAFAAAYWGLGFGFISRRFEREADHYAVGATDPHRFMTALEKLARLGGKPRDRASWRHFSIDDRLDFVRLTRDEPKRARRRAQSARWIRFLLCAAGGAALLRLLVFRPELFGL